LNIYNGGLGFGGRITRTKVLGSRGVPFERITKKTKATEHIASIAQEFTKGDVKDAKVHSIPQENKLRDTRA